MSDAVVKGAEAVKEAVKEDLIVLWEALPSWQQDNHFILSGYRTQSNSYKKSVQSLGYLHNETVNIYTHLIGSLAFGVGSVILWNALALRYPSASTEDVYVFACFFFGAVGCLGMSATYHAISNHSPAVNRVGNKLDYLGIVLLTWGSFIPSVHYGFGPNQEWIKMYWSMVSRCRIACSLDCMLTSCQITTIGAGCGIVSTSSAFATPAWRPFRAGMFACMGLSAVIPVIHGLSLYGVERMESLMGLRWAVLEGLLYLTGAGLYAVSAAP